VALLTKIRGVRLNQPDKDEETNRSWHQYIPELGALFAAIIGRMPALGAWWALDDWGQLARAAGVDPTSSATGIPARWLSQHFYWNVTWPIFGLNPDPYTVTRLLLHGIAAVLVVRLAKRGGLGALPSLVAGLMFAASPIAFTPLYWASGIQELLAAVLALAAVNCWVSGNTLGRKGLAWATVFVTLSIMSKESGLGLPLLFLAMAWFGVGVRLADKAFAWGMIMLQLAVAVLEGVLVFEHFATEPGQAYALGGALLMVSNLFTFGWWLMSPWPILASHVTFAMSITGGLFFAAWGTWGLALLRRKSGFVWLTFMAAILVLAPSLPLQKRVVPYLGYLAVAPLSLLVGWILHSVGPIRNKAFSLWTAALPMVVMASVIGFMGMQLRASQRTEMDLIADPVVRATAVSSEACRTILNLQKPPNGQPTPATGFTHLTLLQPLVDPVASALAKEMGERWAQPTDLYEALSGTRGPQLLLGPDVQVNWANGLTTASSKAMVLCETATGIRFWGSLNNALHYAALTEVGLGHFERARSHINRAAELSGDQIMFIYDEGQMVIPVAMVMRQKEFFTDWTLGLLGEGISRVEVAGLQEQFYNLLSVASGQSVADLTAGSQLIPAQITNPTEKE
jgi:hypothetical protein